MSLQAARDPTSGGMAKEDNNLARYHNCQKQVKKKFHETTIKQNNDDVLWTICNLKLVVVRKMDVELD